MSKTISTVWYDFQGYASPRDKERIQAVQRILTSKIQENVYCQIHNKDITPGRCLMSQFQKECLGCSASTHLCHSCRVKKIAFPAVELCGRCLKVAITLEKNAGKLELPRDLQVPCLLINKTIKVKTCRNMQGEKCRGCEQPSRFCLECKERPARYPIEGLCLTCLVKNFGEGWESNQDKDDTLVSEPVKVLSNVTIRNDPVTKIARQVEGDKEVTKNLQQDKRASGMLTPRQKEVTHLLIKHFIEKSKVLTSRHIAEILNISTNTVNMHLRDIFTALGVHSRAGLICRMLEILKHAPQKNIGIVSAQKQISKQDFRKINIPPGVEKINPRQKCDIIIAFAEVFERLFGEESFGAFLRSIAADMLKFDNIKTALKEAVNET